EGRRLLLFPLALRNSRAWSFHPLKRCLGIANRYTDRGRNQIMTQIGTAGRQRQVTDRGRQENDSTPAVGTYLGVGLYSASEAARLVQMPVATLRRWASECRSSAGGRLLPPPPLIPREDPYLVTRGLFTFSELITLLLVRRLRLVGVPLSGIRS